jgi:hypothetical protein
MPRIRSFKTVDCMSRGEFHSRVAKGSVISEVHPVSNLSEDGVHYTSERGTGSSAGKARSFVTRSYVKESS